MLKPSHLVWIEKFHENALFSPIWRSATPLTLSQKKRSATPIVAEVADLHMILRLLHMIYNFYDLHKCQYVCSYIWESDMVFYPFPGQQYFQSLSNALHFQNLTATLSSHHLSSYDVNKLIHNQYHTKTYDRGVRQHIILNFELSCSKKKTLTSTKAWSLQ